MSRRRTAALAAATIAIAVLFSALAAEIAYRGWIYLSNQQNFARLAQGEGLTIGVYDRSHWEYDARHGFRYPPGRKIAYSHIQHGRLTGCAMLDTINARGNIGPIRGDYDSADLKVLVFGDSFPAFIRDGMTFPAKLQDELAARTGEDVHVVNFGRDGTGILQIVDLAADRIAEWRPDLAVITFTTDDLSRVRIWRAVTEIDGQPRVLTTTEPDPSPTPESGADTYLLEPRADAAWCQETVAKGGEGPLVDSLIERYGKLAQQANYTMGGLTDPTRSFLLSRLLYGDPFADGARFQVPRLRIDDFMEDPGFRDSIARIRDSGVPFVLVHLPIYPEVTDGMAPQFRGPDAALWDSLEAAAGQKVRSLLSVWPEDLEDPARINNAPTDYHPSPFGMQVIATAIADILQRDGLLPAGNPAVSGGRAEEP
ncbi:SGNH/GDSL hydrolase family protein [Marinibaculum pumilum]|uniref:SGNH/GDSL hydrolase family protein n=1 Tax=Marinibaculum pumilum TaxID=1766165 RepID=A0ABV7L7C4_9PROT